MLFVVPTSCARGNSAAKEAFVSEEGRFLAEFPVKPKRTSTSAKSGDQTLTLIVYTAEADNEVVSVAYIDYPPETVAKGPKEVLQASAQGAASALGGKLASNTPLTVLGGDALDFRVEAPEGNATARAFMIGNRMYLLQVFRRDSTKRPAAFERLVSTFRFA